MLQRPRFCSEATPDVAILLPHRLVAILFWTPLMTTRFAIQGSYLLPLLIFLVACSKEKMESMVNTVKDQAKSISESAVIAEVVPATGKAVVQLSSPVEMKASYARLYNIGDGRPGVVQFTSYEPEKGPNAYPALLIRANTTATSLEALAGQTLMGRVYFQQSSGTPVLATPDSALVDLSIAPLDPKKKAIDTTIGIITLYDAKGQSSACNGITLEGLLP